MKKVLITGASGAIGSAIAEAFRDSGYIVYAAYCKNEPKIDGVNKIKIDVTDEASVKSALADIGVLDVLVNNSGISEQKMFCDISLDDWDKMFAVNVRGSFLTARYALPAMIERKSGRIINIASIWGEIGASMEVHYSASKAALIGLTKALAKEVSLSGITVNCISPGMIKSKMNGHLTEEDIEEIKSEIPLKREGTPEEVAKSVLFLASDMADYITGQVISVSGGWNIA